MTDDRSRRRSRSLAAATGMGVLGFLGGVLAMIIVNDLIAGVSPKALMVVAPLSLPLGAIIGSIVAVFLYRRFTR